MDQLDKEVEIIRVVVGRWVNLVAAGTTQNTEISVGTEQEKRV